MFHDHSSSSDSGCHLNSSGAKMLSSSAITASANTAPSHAWYTRPRAPNPVTAHHLCKMSLVSHRPLCLSREGPGTDVMQWVRHESQVCV